MDRPGSVGDRVAVFSPMPPEATGIANFSIKLHMAEPEKWDVFAGEVSRADFEANLRKHGAAYNVMPLSFYQDALKRPEAHRAFVYVVGNNHCFHSAIIEEAIRSQGRPNRWIYLHEAMIQGPMIALMAARGTTFADYLKEWYPEKHVDFTGLIDDRFCAALQDNHILGVRPLVAMSGIDHLIVNNARCRDLVLKDLLPEQRARVVIEQLFLPIEKSPAVEPRRVVTDGTPVVGTFGTPHIFKGTGLVAEAVHLLNTQGTPCRLLMVGSDVTGFAARHFTPEEREHCIFWDDEADLGIFHQLMVGTDVSVQLRTAQHGESSGCVNELLGMGVPVVTNRGFVDADLEPACYCTDPQPTAQNLAETLRQALSETKRRGMTDELFARYSFVRASRMLFDCVCGDRDVARPRRRFFVDATLFDGHGIARSTDFLYRELRRRCPDAEIVYVCTRENPYTSTVPHRFLMVDAAQRDAELTRLVATEKPDFIHFPYNGRQPRGIDAASPSTRIVSTVHDVIPLRIPEVLGFRPENVAAVEQETRTALEQSDVVFCDSEFTVRDIRALFPDCKVPLRCLYFAPMLEVDASAPNRFGRQPFFLYNGGYCPRKGIGILIRNFMHLREKGLLRSELWMTSHPNRGAVGDVALFEEGIAKGWIRELGYVSDEDLCALFRDAVGMVYPSLYEGFGLPPLEAMNAGCPSIVARTSSLPEVCGDAVLWLDDREDDKAFQAALLKLEGDAALRRELIQKGRVQAARFTWEKSVGQFLDALG